MKAIKIGLIGCGRIAGQHVEGYKLASNTRITALCAPHLEKAYSLADKYGLQDVKFFTDYRDMLKQQGIVDAVDIMTPDYLHAPIVLDCAAAGMHILCEKPIALNAEEASRMYEAVKKAGVMAMVGLVYRFNPAVLTVKKLISENLLGEIFHFRGKLTTSRLSNPDIPLEWRQVRDRGGYGALSDLGSHLVDLARYLTEDEFELVTGLGQIFIPTRKRSDTGGSDNVTAYEAAVFDGRLTRSTLVQIEVSRFAAGSGTFEIDGSKGSVRFIDGNIYKWEKEIIDHQKPSSEFKPVDINLDHFEPHKTNICASFAHCIQTRVQEHPDFYDGVICQKVLDAVDKSIRTGRIITLGNE